jgi:glycosyltransferase involved in cell wall biosynthesis
MKILYFSPHPHLKLQASTGYGTHMREMIRAFEELGHEVKFFIGGETKSSPTPSVQSDSPQTNLWKSLLKRFVPHIVWETIKDAQLIRTDNQRGQVLERMCLDFAPDVIYERSHYGMASGVMIAQKLGIHHVLEVNSPNVQERIQLSGTSWLSGKAKKADNYIFSQSDHVLTVSTRLAEMLDIPAVSKDWSVTPNAIRPGQELQESETKTRSDLGINESTFLVGFIGSIFEWHGVDLLIDAIGFLRAKNVNVSALIVGDGAIKDDLIQQSQTLGIKNHIVWTGTVPHDQIHGLGKLCDCLIMPKTNMYGSPVKIFEYALCHKPVIAPDASPVREVMENNAHGLIVPPDASEITRAIVHLKNNSQLGAEYANNWRQKVLCQHTWKQNAAVALKLVRGHSNNEKR